MIIPDLQDGFDLADENVIDVQTITDAMMTTSQSLTELGIRLLLNLFVCWLLVHFFYYRKSRRRDYYFTFMVFSSAMLLLLYMMGNAEVGVGLTLGLFAIFGVIRYRTETVPIREMTYLFIIIAVAAVNGLSPLYKLVGMATDAPHYELSAGFAGLDALRCHVVDRAHDARRREGAASRNEFPSVHPTSFCLSGDYTPNHPAQSMPRLENQKTEKAVPAAMAGNRLPPRAAALRAHLRYSPRRIENWKQP